MCLYTEKQKQKYNKYKIINVKIGEYAYTTKYYELDLRKINGRKFAKQSKIRLSSWCPGVANMMSAKEAANHF